MSRPAFVVGLGVIVVAALALRLAGTEWGKPYAYHFDEPFVVKPALRIVDSGDPNPHFFRYPSLMIYVEAAIAAGNHVISGMPLAVPEGPAYGPSDLGTWTWPALAGGRHAVAVLGTAAIVLAAIVAFATGGAMAALLAALLLAVLPLHVEHSHYLTTDVPAATFLLGSFACLARVRIGMRAAAWAGVAAGLAIATKYTMATALPALALLCALRADPSVRAKAKSVAILLGACGAAFLLACPYALLDWHTFIAEINVVREHYGGGHLGAEGAGNWSWYVQRLRDEGLGDAGLILLAVGAAGAVYDLVRAHVAASPPNGGEMENDAARTLPARTASQFIAVLLVLTLGWFLWLGGVTVRFERNLMPIVVLACPVAGHGLARLLDALARRSAVLRGIGIAAIALVGIGPARISGGIARRLSSVDTRAQALAWIEANVPVGSHIVREEYTPQPDANRYEVEYLWSLGFQEPRDYRRSGVDYVVASQAVYARFLNDPARRYPDIVDRYQRIFRLPRAAAFVPDAQATGPAVTIYRVARGRRAR